MHSLPLHDPRWAQLEGGYRRAFDPSRAIRAVASGQHEAAAWDELWQELHHQGDVGSAAYASIPALVVVAIERSRCDWNLLALASVIEFARMDGNNPEIAEWCVDAYHDAWIELPRLALRALAGEDDEDIVRASLAVIGISKGLHRSSRLFFDFDESEIDEIYDRVYDQT